MSPQLWSCKSTSKLAQELAAQGPPVGPRTVCHLLAQMNYRLQSVRKSREENQHSDRDAQYQYIARTATQYRSERQPVIAVDAKTKELIGDLENAGRGEWRPAGGPEQVRVHDFLDPELGRVSPHGVYDLTASEAWVSVGANHDTAEFAVESIRRRCLEMGRPLYGDAQRLPITADCDGSNGYIGRAHGACNCRGWQTNSSWKCASATSLRRRASGTGSSIRCSVTSPKTGEGVRCRHVR